MVEFANSNDVKVILISGDLFDGGKPLVKDKDFFFSVVQNNPNIDFLYLKGNHDLMLDGKEFSNLKTFTDNWSYYRYGNICIAGVEMIKENATSIYSTLTLSDNDINIVMLHGEVGDTCGVDKVNLSKLRGKNVNYLALGHYHSNLFEKLDDKGVYAYAGCLEGRGYDETGDKGFILLDVTEKFSYEFVPFSKSKISVVKVDVTSLKDAYSIYLNTKAVANFNKNGIYRIELIGEVDANLEGIAEDVKKYLSQEASFIDVKDLTKKKLDISKYEGDKSLKGEFVRIVYGEQTLSDEDKFKIISYGLKALAGEEIDL